MNDHAKEIAELKANAAGLEYLVAGRDCTIARLDGALKKACEDIYQKDQRIAALEDLLTQAVQVIAQYLNVPEGVVVQAKWKELRSECQPSRSRDAQSEGQTS